MTPKGAVLADSHDGDSWESFFLREQDFCQLTALYGRRGVGGSWAGEWKPRNPRNFTKKIKSGSLGGGFVGFECFVGFRDFRGFLDGRVDRYGAKVAKGRKGRWGFGGIEDF